MQIGELRRTPAALAGDDLIGAACRRPHHQRLHKPSLADRGGKLLELRFGKVSPRVEAAGLECGKRNAPLFLLEAKSRFIEAIADEGREPPSQSCLLRACRHGSLLPLDSPINDHAARIRRSRSITSEA